MRRSMHDGQKPRPLHGKGTRSSSPQRRQAVRTKPCEKSPHTAKPLSSPWTKSEAGPDSPPRCARGSGRGDAGRAPRRRSGGCRGERRSPSWRRPASLPALQLAAQESPRDSITRTREPLSLASHIGAADDSPAGCRTGRERGEREGRLRVRREHPWASPASARSARRLPPFPLRRGRRPADRLRRLDGDGTVSRCRHSVLRIPESDQTLECENAPHSENARRRPISS